MSTITCLSGVTSATVFRESGRTSGGGPDPEIMNITNHRRTPTPSAARGLGSSAPSRKPIAANHSTLNTNPPKTPSSDSGLETSQLNSAATIRTRALKVAATKATKTCAPKTLEAGTAEARKRRSTPRSRYPAMCSGSAISPIEAVTSPTYAGM